MVRGRLERSGDRRKIREPERRKNVRDFREWESEPSGYIREEAGPDDVIWPECGPEDEDAL